MRADVAKAVPVLASGVLYTDGGSRGNPGESGIGYVLQVVGSEGARVISSGGWYLGRATNNQAEYHALIWGLENALDLGFCDIQVKADSELLVKQLNKEYRVKNDKIKPLFALAEGLLSRFDTVSVSHVRRAYNSQADGLANAAMDNAGPVGDFARGYLEPTPELFATQEVPGGPGSQSPKPETTDRKGSRNMGKGSGIYTLTVKEHFDAAHALIGYPGECRNLHGHTWDVEASVQGTVLDEVGIVYDFKDLKRNLLAILDQFDHKYLNEVPPFDKMNSTAENLARVVYEQLGERLPEGIELVEVAVWESPIARLIYRQA